MSRRLLSSICQPSAAVPPARVQDVDDLNNPSPLSALNAVASRTNVDHNRRQLDIVGARFQPRYKLFGGNDLLLGIDWERSWISSIRERAGGTDRVFKCLRIRG